MLIRVIVGWFCWQMLRTWISLSSIRSDLSVMEKSGRGL